MMQESVTAYANSVGWFHISIIGFSYDLRSKKWHTVPRFFCVICSWVLGSEKIDNEKSICSSYSFINFSRDFCTK